MTLINLIKICENNEVDDLVLYRTFHENNRRYLEREGESGKFKILYQLFMHLFDLIFYSQFLNYTSNLHVQNLLINNID